MIEVKASIAKTIQDAWQLWTGPEHIVNWNFASDDWHCPEAQNDLRPGGKFSYRMAAKDGSMAFDFCGTYSLVDKPNKIVFALDDGRKVQLDFTEQGENTLVVETFEPETIHSEDLQRQGWQAILNNFKAYAEKF